MVEDLALQLSDQVGVLKASHLRLLASLGELLDRMAKMDSILKQPTNDTKDWARLSRQRDQMAALQLNIMSKLRLTEDTDVGISSERKRAKQRSGSGIGNGGSSADTASWEQLLG